MENTPTGYNMRDARELSEQQVELIKEYHQLEDFETPFEEWFKDQTWMDIDYILDKMQ